ncbi:hypothetical protein FGO68_gene8551 [Halteria grandinella]|uniref:Uncharacterized protein n=1 Tax=Halteria grandinella TaxID=5974 RepID=A0A8J8T6Z6_HALGN|nr:hypothetical protein FGO68_gene8551 [Halteria grandinella]
MNRRGIAIIQLYNHKYTPEKMVFQDYELIQTKRVAAQRQSTNPFNKRLWNAAGGWNTLYVTLFFGVAGYQFRQVCSSSRGALFWTIVPAFLAYGFGVTAFGNKQEFSRLNSNVGQYKAEFQNYKQELFYS